jgi:hypothetical protein
MAYTRRLEKKRKQKKTAELPGDRGNCRFQVLRLHATSVLIRLEKWKIGVVIRLICDWTVPLVLIRGQGKCADGRPPRGEIASVADRHWPNWQSPRRCTNQGKKKGKTPRRLC